MTPSEKYIEGKWYGWNGGECPVHPETVVDAIYLIEKDLVTLQESRCAEYWLWNSISLPIIAFRVVKHYVEPKVVWMNEYNGNGCLVHQTKEDAIKFATKDTTRIAVRYVETPE